MTDICRGYGFPCLSGNSSPPQWEQCVCTHEPFPHYSPLICWLISWYHLWSRLGYTTNGMKTELVRLGHPLVVTWGCLLRVIFLEALKDKCKKTCKLWPVFWNFFYDICSKTPNSFQIFSMVFFNNLPIEIQVHKY